MATATVVIGFPLMYLRSSNPTLGILDEMPLPL